MNPARVFGYPKSQTPKLVTIKNMVELVSIVPLWIFLEKIPRKEILINAKYTNGSVEWNPKKRSLINIHNIGIIRANLLFPNWWPANKAIPVIGATLGGWGSSLVATAISTIVIIIKFLFIFDDTILKIT